jgi:3-oxoacyl-(acyl-carrier-protein) synthase
VNEADPARRSAGRRAVYVRGAGAVTPLGATWPESVRELARGRSAVGPIRAFDAAGFPCTVAASIEHPLLGRPDLRAGWSAAATEDRRLDLARFAAREAWRAAGVTAAPRRTGVFIGAESGRARFETILRLARAAGGGKVFDHARFGVHARPLAVEIGPSVVSPAAVASALAGEIGARGPAQTISLACASGNAAIVEAARAIRLGRCDVALCGGVGADVDPIMIAGFGALSALSARGISCPFDAHRDGFVVGEGAAMVVLSSEPGPVGGADATSIVEVAGLGRSLDAYHLTAPDPAGDGARRAMLAALLDAGLDAVDYVQAHGTSTPLNDAVEAAAIRGVLGAHLDRAHVSSIKGAVGHWIAGAGAVGFLCGLEAVARGVVLPTAGLARPDADCALPHVLGEAIHKDVGAAMVNSFAFGGANSCVVLRRAA